jgi:uncharacterized repeat protein (TIGR01451 family)
MRRRRYVHTRRPACEPLEPRALLATFSVTGTADGGPGSLRQAIIDANNTSGDDTINLPAGTYTLTIAGTGENAGATGDLDITDGLTLNGAGAATTIIDAAGIDRVIDIIGVDPVSISGVTLRNGNAGTDFTGGGGVHVTSGPGTDAYTTTFTDCIITGNTAVNGGGINNDDTQNNSLMLVRTTVSNNTASTDGAGIVHGPNGTGSLTLTDCIVRDNKAGRENGGILAAAGLPSDLTITGSTISGNSAPGGTGGGITWFGSAFVLTNSTVSGNTAGTDGGGILTSGGNVTMTNCTISGNSAGRDGGGIVSFNTGSLSGPYTLTNMTITGNVADGDNNGTGNGGGIFNVSPGIISLANTIVAGNNDRGGQAPDCSGTITSLGHNLIQSTTGCTITGDTSGNITGQDARLGPLVDNGGPTSTHALLAGSPAIDAASATGAPATDQRGVSRPQGNGFDIGAFELRSAAPPAVANLSVSVTASNPAPAVGTDVTFTIVTSNAGPDTATNVQLGVALPVGASFVSASGGVVPAAGALTFNLGNLANGAQAAVTVVVHVTAAGPLRMTATVTAAESSPAAASGAVAAVAAPSQPPATNPTQAPAMSTAPTVRKVERFGFHMQPTLLVVTFSDDLDQAHAVNPANYRVAAPGRDGRVGTRDDRSIAVALVRYDQATRTVLLRPAHRLDVHRVFRLTVVGGAGSGLTSRSGVALAGDGRAGSDFIARIDRSLLAGRASLAGPVALSARLRRSGWKESRGS